MCFQKSKTSERQKTKEKKATRYGDRTFWQTMLCKPDKITWQAQKINKNDSFLESEHGHLVFMNYWNTKKIKCEGANLL